MSSRRRPAPSSRGRRPPPVHAAATRSPPACAAACPLAPSTRRRRPRLPPARAANSPARPRPASSRHCRPPARASWRRLAERAPILPPPLARALAVVRPCKLAGKRRHRTAPTGASASDGFLERGRPASYGHHGFLDVVIHASDRIDETSFFFGWTRHFSFDWMDEDG